MIFYLHFILLTSGLSGTSVLLGVFMKYYSDASQAEIGVLLMTFPFMNLVIRPLFCSLADKHQAHRGFLVTSLLVLMIGFMPFIIIPYFPEFYTHHARLSWYSLVASCYVGNAGLAVAWSLGESLAVNAGQRKNTPYGRMRLCGTVSWGVYGYIIGEINEVPFLPKFVPAFLILNVSVLTEIIMLLLWDKDEFRMVDTSVVPEISQQVHQVVENKQDELKVALPTVEQFDKRQEAKESPAGSLSGSLRLKTRAGVEIRDIMLCSEDLNRKLKNLEPQQDETEKSQQGRSLNWIKRPDSDLSTLNHQQLTSKSMPTERNTSNPQVVMFKLIMAVDGRLIKYLIMFTMVGLLLAPLNFVFLSMDEVCKEKGCNFSHLAGSVLISQATSETLCFLVVPWFLMRIKRSTALLFALGILATRYLFYACFYYTSNISPYWALVGEWGHGIGYAICATILAEVALVFANQCKFFIPELRQLGFFTPNEKGNEEKVLAEENAMKMALRATMQAVFSAAMDGLGNGVGSLICGIVVEAYSYIKLWQLLMIMALGTGMVHQLIEVTKSKWSDSFQPAKGTKAFEIRSVEQSHKCHTVASKATKHEVFDCEAGNKC